MNKIFSLDFSKDIKFIGKTFKVNNLEEKPIKSKLIDIDKEGYYIFQVIDKNSEFEGFSTKVPNNGDITL